MNVMKGRLICTDAELRTCIENQQQVEVWVGGEYDDVCFLIGFNDVAVEVVEGFYYLRQNIIIMEK
jgi:hypothetical protein